MNFRPVNRPYGALAAEIAGFGSNRNGQRVRLLSCSRQGTWNRCLWEVFGLRSGSCSRSDRHLRTGYEGRNNAEAIVSFPQACVKASGLK